jgi:hypothetical protein
VPFRQAEVILREGLLGLLFRHIYSQNYKGRYLEDSNIRSKRPIEFYKVPRTAKGHALTFMQLKAYKRILLIAVNEVMVGKHRVSTGGAW